MTNIISKCTSKTKKLARKMYFSHEYSFKGRKETWHLSKFHSVDADYHSSYTLTFMMPLLSPVEFK